MIHLIHGDIDTPWKMNDWSCDIFFGENTTWDASPRKSCGIECRNTDLSFVPTIFRRFAMFMNALCWNVLNTAWKN